MSVFEADLEPFLVAQSEQRVFVHAGVVGWKGQAIVIPGRSHSGKTQLVAALIGAGASYYSDECAVFNLRGQVLPYPRPLHLRQSNGERVRCVAEDFGGSNGRRPLPVGLIVVTRFRAGAVWRPRVLSAGQAILSLMANSGSARKNPDAAFELFEQAVSGALALKGVRGEANEVARNLLDRLPATTRRRPLSLFRR